VIVEVAFKGNRKEFFHWKSEEPLPLRVAVIVEADRGEDLGYVHATGELAEKRLAGVPHAPQGGVQLNIRRRATSNEVKRVEELRADDDTARKQSAERTRAAGLPMKVTDAEWRWDRRKLTLYFTAEKRVDFRNLVRDLAASFRTRIELKQIGVRDEAKRLGGIGRCGREYCSASWLPDLRPVNLGVAREQRLSLNPTQISGACGRLMCCLRYEHDFYVQQRKRFPKEGKIIETSKGEEKVIANDIFRERVTLRNVEGETRLLPLAELRREWKNAPAGPQGVEEEVTSPDEGISDEVLRMEDTAEMPVWLPRPEPPARENRRLPVKEAPPRESRRLPVKDAPPREAPRREERRPTAQRTQRPTPAPPPPGPTPRREGEASASEGERSNRRRRGRRGGRRPGGGPATGEGDSTP
jgi:cell fate regulator YaaT (PSP1 superfamily)